MTHTYRVIVKFANQKPQAFTYKHADGALTYAQDKSLHGAAGFQKVTVSDSNRVLFAYAKDALGWRK